MKYAFIHAHAREFPVAVLCKLLEVSRSGCYAAHNRPLSLRSREDLALRAKVEDLHERHRQAPGIIKTWHLLRAEGVHCGRNRLARLRQLAGIITKRTKRFRNMRTYQKSEPPAPNLVNREFDVPLPDRVWVGDITAIPTRAGTLHLAAFIDLCTHTVVGWASATSQTATLAKKALQMGIAERCPSAGMICHTDQGSQFAATIFRQHLAEHKIQPSMSRKGNCHDNAVAESFFSNLKNELTHHITFENPEIAAAAINEYIGVYYNQHRIHQTLGYRTPAEVEKIHRCS